MYARSWRLHKLISLWCEYMSALSTRLDAMEARQNEQAEVIRKQHKHIVQSQDAQGYSTDASMNSMGEDSDVQIAQGINTQQTSSLVIKKRKQHTTPTSAGTTRADSGNKSAHKKPKQPSTVIRHNTQSSLTAHNTSHMSTSRGYVSRLPVSSNNQPTTTTPPDGCNHVPRRISQ
jgi:hypothetical protein